MCVVTRWAILTGEYAPKPGGVADYTRQVACKLSASGDRVTVYSSGTELGPETDDGVTIRRLPDHFGPRGLVTLDRWLAASPRADRILIQYVPHAYGYRALNLPFAVWVATRGRRLAPVWVMFHEVAFPIGRGQPLKHNFLGAVTRLMARLIAGAAARTFVSIPAWADLLRGLGHRGVPAEWLPVPSNISASPNVPPADVRGRFGWLAGTRVIGHFGTFGGLLTPLLGETLAAVLRRSDDRAVLLIGRRGDEYRRCFLSDYPELASRVVATGEVPADELPGLLRGCEFLLQPYPDGISTRRTTAMAGLACGMPVVTNSGWLSESIWHDIGGVVMADGPSPESLAAAADRLLALPAHARADLGRRAAAVYQSAFAIERTVATLRGTAPAMRLCAAYGDRYEVADPS